MIGYEFEFFMENKNSHEPMNQKEFQLFHKELEKGGWKVEKDPLTGGIVGSKKAGIKITTDDAVYLAEINMLPKKTVNEADNDAKEIIEYLKKILDPLNVRILGIGMFPGHVPSEYDYTCHKAFIRYITPRRYWLNRTIMHQMAACQYWFDIPKDSIAECINIMNKLNGICVALLGNSSFNQNRQTEHIEERLHAWIKFVENPYPYDKKITGIPDREFSSFMDYLEYCFKATFYGCAWYSGVPFYLEDQSKTNEDYFFSDEIEILQVDGKRKRIKPVLGDLYDLIQKNVFLDCRLKFTFKEDADAEDFKKAYKEKNEKAILGMLDKVCVENRFIASQNKEEFSIGAAFIRGLIGNLEKTKELLGKKDYGYWKELREKAIKDGLDFEMEGKHITDLLDEFMQIAEEGLKKRGYGEEKFLDNAKDFIFKKENPGQRKVRLFKEGGIEKVIADSVL